MTSVISLKIYQNSYILQIKKTYKLGITIVYKCIYLHSISLLLTLYCACLHCVPCCLSRNIVKCLMFNKIFVLYCILPKFEFQRAGVTLKNGQADQI